MSDLEQLDAAREADRRLWTHFDLAVAERFIEVGADRRRVRLLECGDPAGTPIVFVQGGLGEAASGASLIARLREFRCIALDRPGSGFSDGVDFTRIDPRRLALEVLTAAADAAGLGQAVFVASSMGAWWTLQLALDQPARVSRLVLLGCPAGLLDSSAPFPMRLMTLPLIGPALAAGMVPASLDRARALPTFLGHPRSVGERWSDPEAEVAFRFGHLPDFRRSWATMLRRFLRVRGFHPGLRISAAALRTVAQPTLFLWGRDDPFGSVEVGRAAAALMPDARMETVGIGHLPWWDDPDACARLIREFIPGHLPAREATGAGRASA